MKVYGGVDIYIHIFLTSALVGGEWSASRPSHFTPSTHWIGGWVCPRTGLDDVKRKILPLLRLEICPLSRPADSFAIPTALSWSGASGLESSKILKKAGK
jgi:hypothetical protein